MAEPRKGTQVLKDTGAYAAAQLGGQAAASLAGFLVAGFLGTFALGTWRLLNIFFTYSGYIQMGLLHAMSRELPIRLGEGDADGERRILHLTFSGMFGLSLLGAAAYLAASCWPGIDPDFRLGFRFFAPVLVARLIYDYYRIYLRAVNRFQALSRVHLATHLFTAAANVTLAYYFGLRGLFVSMLLIALFGLAVIAAAAGYRPRFWWDRVTAAAQVRIGLPLMFIGITHELLVSADSLMIAAVLGRGALGLYAIGVMTVRMVEMVPNALGQVVYTRLGRIYGEGGRDPAVLETYVKIPTVLLAHLAPLAGGLLFFVFPLLIRWWLHDFEGGITAGRILIASVFFRGMLGITGGFLAVIDRQKQYLAIQAVALVLNIVLNALFLAAGRGIEGVALGTGLSYLAYSVILLSYMSARFPRDGRRGPDGRFLCRLYLPVVLSLAAVFLLERPLSLGLAGVGCPAAWIPEATVLSAAVVFVLLHIALLAAARREMEWLKELLGSVRAPR